MNNPEIPVFDRYDFAADDDFWNTFPSCDLPDYSKPITEVKVNEFLKLFHQVKPHLSEHEIQEMYLVFDSLSRGADARVDESQLPPIFCQNASSIYDSDIGSGFTDQLASMVRLKYIAGPFKKPPLKNFRVNQLLGVRQHNKVRPVMNLSFPKKRSFNSAIKKGSFPKVTMASAKMVADAILRQGRACKLSKLDQRNAYKLVPARENQLRLQGLFWLGKYFVELRQVFGASSSVYNYDVVHQCISTFARIISGIPADCLFRTLDDQVCVCADFNAHKRFVSSYLSVCHQLDVPLASFDGKKAFRLQTAGTILGVHFDAPTLTWSLDNEKIDRYLSTLDTVKRQPSASLKDMQKINGIINVVVIMCPHLRFFRAAIINDLKRAHKRSPIELSVDCKDQINMWLRLLSDLKHRFPLCPPVPTSHARLLSFVTDAAGVSKEKIAAQPHDIGVGACGIDSTGKIYYTGQAFWPISFVSAKDDRGVFCGFKTTSLELLGWFLPLYHNRHNLTDGEVQIFVDNMSSVFAFKNGRSHIDNWASFLLTGLMFVMTALNCRVRVDYLRRVSTYPAVIADLLTRTDPKGIAFVQRLKLPLHTSWPPALLAWMLYPTFDPQFKWKLLKDFLN